MRQAKLFIVVVAIAVSAVGCNSREEKSPPGQENPGTATPQAAEVKKEVTEAAQAVKDYTFAQKAEFVADMKHDLAEIRQELDRLSAKIESAGDEVRDEDKAELRALREKTAQLNKQLDEVENATESTWDEVKGGFWKSYGEVKSSFQKTRRWLGGKIEP